MIDFKHRLQIIEFVALKQKKSALFCTFYAIKPVQAAYS